jgi:Holliday junction resolvase RusA-like endonuclease
MTEDEFRKMQEKVALNRKKKLNFPEAKVPHDPNPLAKALCDIVRLKLNKPHEVILTDPPVRANFDPDAPKSRFIVPGPPVPAPRMTRSDRWKKRPCVQRYFEYRDRIQQVVGDLPTVPPCITLEFHIAMPESWGKCEKIARNGREHLKRPDCDNLIKACLDSLFLEDGGVSDLTARKRWCYAGQEKTVISFL